MSYDPQKPIKVKSIIYHRKICFLPSGFTFSYPKREHWIILRMWCCWLPSSSTGVDFQRKAYKQQQQQQQQQQHLLLVQHQQQGLRQPSTQSTVPEDKQEDRKWRVEVQGQQQNGFTFF